MIFLTVASLVILPVVVLAIRSGLAGQPKNLGTINGRLAPCPDSPNCVSSQAEEAEHSIAAIPFTETPDQALAQLIAVIEKLPRFKIIKVDEAYVHAEATSRMFRFVDDVEFLVDSDEKVIHVRSASRVGYSDLGANRARVLRLREVFMASPASHNVSP